ncbi:hypothetical protein ACFSTD_03775 [Novosphingobium colocasiae]
MIGISVLGGTGSYSSYLANASATDSPAVVAARKAFTTPTTTAPWASGASESGATSAQVAAIKRLATIIDTTKDSSFKDLPDIQTAFTTYKALENLRVLAEAATSKTLSDTSRAALQKTFAKGLADLQGYLGTADTDLLQLGFGAVTSTARTLGIEIALCHVTGGGHRRDQDPRGGGRRAGRHRGVPGHPDARRDQRDGAGQPGPVHPAAHARFRCRRAERRDRGERRGGCRRQSGGRCQWQPGQPMEIALHGGEDRRQVGGWCSSRPAPKKVSIDQADAGDALMVASGETTTISGTVGPTSANVYRIEDLSHSLTWERLSKINAVDTTATARAEAAAAAAAKSLGTATTDTAAQKADHTVFAPPPPPTPSLPTRKASATSSAPRMATWARNWATVPTTCS